MPDKMTLVLKAIADPTRRELFHALVVAATALPINQVAAQFSMSRQGVSKHLKVLDTAGLISMETSGRERFCKANPGPLQEVQKWLSFYDRFWDHQLGNLEHYLDRKKDT